MMLEQYGHGGDLQTAAALYGIPPGQFLDFSANMNPLGPPALIANLLQEHWRTIAHYPDPVSRRLREKLAQRYEIPVESILVGNGAAELIELVVRWKQPDTTVLVRPCFSEYEQAIRKIGGAIYDIWLSDESDFDVSAEAVMQALHRADAAFLGHPNNPTGRLLPFELMQQLMEFDDPNKTVILDEAFIDFVENERECTMLRHAAKTEGKFVIRSMTKFYAIPGLRLGFIVGHPDAIRRLRELQTPWSVNSLAQIIGEAVLDDDHFARQTLQWLKIERPWFQQQLMQLGLRVFPGKVNYVLFQLPHERGITIRELQQQLGHKGILIRNASHFPGLDESYGRLAIKQRDDNVTLLQTLREIIG